MALNEDDSPRSPTEKIIPAQGKGGACIPGLSPECFERWLKASLIPWQPLKLH